MLDISKYNNSYDILYQIINYIKDERNENYKLPIIVDYSAGIRRIEIVINIDIIILYLEYLKKWENL